MKAFALTFVVLVLLAMGWPGVAVAQCLSLRQLIALANDPALLTTPAQATQLPAADWKFEGPVPRTRDIFWSSTSKSGSGLPKVTLTLRPMQQTLDAVLKTTDPACIRQIRAELKDLHRTFVNVNCPGGCEAQRYDGTLMQTTIYSRMPGDYPFVVVVHPLAAPVVPAAPAAKPASGSGPQ